MLLKNKIKLIEDRFNQDLKDLEGKLDENLLKWLIFHRIVPQKIKLFSFDDVALTNQTWLITDHVGNEDSSYRIIFDELVEMYGLEMTTQDNKYVFLGDYGTLFEAMTNM